MLQHQDTAHAVQAAKCTCNITLSSIYLETLSLSSGRWQVNVRFAARPCKPCTTCQRAIKVVDQMRGMHCYRSISPHFARFEYGGRRSCMPGNHQPNQPLGALGERAFLHSSRYLHIMRKKAGKCRCCCCNHRGQAGRQDQARKAPLVGLMPNSFHVCSCAPAAGS